MHLWQNNTLHKGNVLVLARQKSAKIVNCLGLLAENSLVSGFYWKLATILGFQGVLFNKLCTCVLGSTEKQGSWRVINSRDHEHLPEGCKGSL